MPQDDSDNKKKGRPNQQEAQGQAVLDAVGRFGRIGRLRSQGHISRETILKAGRIAGIPQAEMVLDTTAVEQWLTSEGCDAYFAINDAAVHAVIAAMIDRRHPVDDPGVNILALAAMAALNKPAYEDPKGSYTTLKVGMLVQMQGT